MTSSLVKATSHSPRPLPRDREPHFHCDPRRTTPKAPVYLGGCWQSERHFREIANLLCREIITLEVKDGGTPGWRR